MLTELAIDWRESLNTLTVSVLHEWSCQSDIQTKQSKGCTSEKTCILFRRHQSSWHTFLGSLTPQMFFDFPSPKFFSLSLTLLLFLCLWLHLNDSGKPFSFSFLFCFFKPATINLSNILIGGGEKDEGGKTIICSRLPSANRLPVDVKRWNGDKRSFGS